MVKITPKITPVELLLIARRRRGENQITAAHGYKVSFDTYSLWERGMQRDGLPFVQIKNITELEAFFIYRRRAKITRKELAKNLDCSLTWLNLMERGQCNNSALREYWKNKQ